MTSIKKKLYYKYQGKPLHASRPTRPVASTSSPSHYRSLPPPPSITLPLTAPKSPTITLDPSKTLLEKGLPIS